AGRHADQGRRHLRHRSEKRSRPSARGAGAHRHHFHGCRDRGDHDGDPDSHLQSDQRRGLMPGPHPPLWPAHTIPPAELHYEVSAMKQSIRHPQRRMANAQSGFSLMEILIVIVLIGMVVAFAANQILGGADKAKWQLARSQVTTLSTKIEGYALDNGSAPERLEDLVKQPGNAPSWLGPYAKAEDIKDPRGRD